MGGTNTTSRTIPLLDSDAERAARARQDLLTKPKGSLGRLEDIACRMAAIQASPRPVVRGRHIVVAAADHGVTAESISPYPPEVTAQMVANFLRGGAAICVLARQAGASMTIVDAGVKLDIPGDTASLLRVAQMHGTCNMTREPAMPTSEAVRLIEAGRALSRELAMKGVDVVATGDMGIGNTTAAAALTAVFTGMSPAEVTGRGAGIDDPGLRHKVSVVEKALECNRPAPGLAVEALACVGGCEIAFLTGLILGAAESRVAIALDGYVSTSAALVAAAMQPPVTDYVFACHLSAEPGHRHALKKLGMDPLLALDMRLGEGTGAALGILLIEAAVRLHNDMATFDQAGVSGKS